jgi:hypothetical protein
MAGYAQLLNNPPIASISTASFTGPTDVSFSTTQPPLVIPANYLKRGDVIKTTSFGSFSTTGTPTAVVGPYWGTTVLAVNVALTTASGAATLPWRLETWSTVYAIGTAGAIITHGQLQYGTTLTAVTTIPDPGIALATVAVDTTAAATWTTKWTWSASSASNIVVTYGHYIEHLNCQP